MATKAKVAILRTKPALLEDFLFIKDGPLAFFGQTSNMHQPMRALVKFLLARHNLYLAGLEKSGPFVEHADEIRRDLLHAVRLDGLGAVALAVAADVGRDGVVAGIGKRC